MRLLEWISRKAMLVAGWCYLIITGLICFDIVARRILGFSTEATVELTGYLMAGGMTLAMAGTLYERGHVRIDVLVQKLPLKVRVWLHLASLLALIVVLATFLYGAWYTVQDSWALKASDNSALRTPLVVPQGLWLGGLVLFAFAAVALLARSIGLLVQGRLTEMERGLMARTDLDEADDTLKAMGHPTLDAKALQ